MLKQGIEFVGKLPGGAAALSRIPLAWRYGRAYGRADREADYFESLDPEHKRRWILEKFKELVKHAESKVPFYREFYGKSGFSACELRCFDDIEQIPIVTKSDLQAVSLGERSAVNRHSLVSNTGGTTGQPLSFMVEPFLKAKEQAYIHRMWRRRDFGAGVLKLGFRGTNLKGQLLHYNPREGEFVVNTYASYDQTCGAIVALLKRHSIQYLHGYPSAIYGFACYCRDHFEESLAKPLRSSLQGILLGSEYPAPRYRKVIEEVFGPITLSWYGHSEMAVLAGENRRPYVYEPFQSYGYVEAADSRNSGSKRLLGTNYDSFAGPLIRYDTGDLIEPVQVEDGMLKSFRVAEGRVGDFVLDANGHPVSLTALIFGRHHAVFEKVNHLQVAQDVAGEVLIVAAGSQFSEDVRNDFWKGFDSSGVDIRFDVKFVDKPYRTTAGKVPLMIPFPKG